MQGFYVGQSQEQARLLSATPLYAAVAGGGTPIKLGQETGR